MPEITSLLIQEKSLKPNGSEWIFNNMLRRLPRLARHDEGEVTTEIAQYLQMQIICQYVPSSRSTPEASNRHSQIRLKIPRTMQLTFKAYQQKCVYKN